MDALFSCTFLLDTAPRLKVSSLDNIGLVRKAEGDDRWQILRVVPNTTSIVVTVRSNLHALWMIVKSIVLKNHSPNSTTYDEGTLIDASDLNVSPPEVLTSTPIINLGIFVTSAAALLVSSHNNSYTPKQGTRAMPNHNVRLPSDPLPHAESRLVPPESEGDRHRQRQRDTPTEKWEGR